jgi:pimeloyl-ACP methyl ester carboxylesterase
MAFLARALRRHLGPAVDVRQVQYRLRGWNGPRMDPLRDAQGVLEGVQRHFEPDCIAVVGHSMGGRVAAHLAAGGGVGAVVALAPWWEHGDGDLIPTSTRLLAVHGSADTITNPGTSRAQVDRARQRGVDAQWVGIDGVGHHMVRRWPEWHRLTMDFVTRQLSP